MFGGLAWGIAQITPDDELPRDRGPEMINRPASAASAARCVKAALVLNTALVLAFLLLCAILWRTAQESAVAWWLLPAEVGLIAAGVVPLLVAAFCDRAEKRERTR